MVKPVILVFIDWYKPAFKAGGPITSCVNLIEALKNRFEFKVFTASSDYLDDHPMPNIIEDSWIQKDQVTVFYASKNNRNRKKIKEIINQTPYDVLWINGIFSPTFSIAPLIYRKKEKPSIISVRGMLGKNVLQFKPVKKHGFLWFSKVMRWHKGVRFHATSEQEKTDIQEVFPINEIRVAANVPSRSVELKPLPPKSAGILKVIQVARIAKEKNTLFSINCLANLTGKVQMDIVGSVYDSEFADLCFKEAKKLNATIEVNFLGSISPFELPKLLRNYHLFFLPTLGENFGHAISEALSNGLPVLISNKTIWQNLLEFKAGFDLPLELDKFTEKIQFFIDLDQKEFDNFSKGALNYFEIKVNWTEIINQNIKLFKF